MQESEDRASPRSGFHRENLQFQLETMIGCYAHDRERYIQELDDRVDWSPILELQRGADEIAQLIRKRATLLANTGEVSDRNQVHQTFRDAMDRLDEEAAARQAALLAAIDGAIEGSRQVHPAAEAARKVAELERLRAIVLTEASPPKTPRSTMGHLLPPGERDDSPMRLVWEAMCIADAWEVVSGLEARVRRQFELERLVDELVATPNHAESTAAFLSLVSRCFVYGFDAECLAMCRGAMEQAFRAKVSYEHCELAGRRWDPKRKDGSHLADRIWAAFAPEPRLLSGRSDVYDAANRVKARGDAAVHKGPGVTGKILETIRDTLLVIDTLASLPDAECSAG